MLLILRSSCPLLMKTKIRIKDNTPNFLLHINIIKLMYYPEKWNKNSDQRHNTTKFPPTLLLDWCTILKRAIKLQIKDIILPSFLLHMLLDWCTILKRAITQTMAINFEYFHPVQRTICTNILVSTTNWRISYI